MKLFTVILGGALAGLVHRLIISPRVGTLKPNTQSVMTPAFGVLLTFPVFVTSLANILNSTMPTRNHDDNAKSVAVVSAAFAYMGAFMGYGAAVVVSIIAGIGGVKVD